MKTLLEYDEFLTEKKNGKNIIYRLLRRKEKERKRKKKKK